MSKRNSGRHELPRLGPFFWLEAAIAQAWFVWEGHSVSKAQRQASESGSGVTSGAGF